MENSGGAANDQGSGWFEVRKKHRSSSKASLHSSDGTGRFSGKYVSVNQQPSSTEKNWNLRGNTRPWISAREVKASTLEHGDIADITHISNKDENDTCFHQKSTVKLGREESGCPRSSVLFTTNFSAVAGDTLMTKQKDNLILVPKIKWGDLDDNDFVLHHESNSQPDVRCSQIQDRSLVDKLENNGSLFSWDSSCTDLPENKSAAASVDICPDQIVLNYDKDVIKENCEGVSEISSKHVQEPFVCGKSIALDSSGFNEVDKKHDHDLLPGGETGTTLKIQLPVSEVNESKVFDVHISHENSVVIPESDKLVLFENNGPDTSREAGIGDNSKSPAISLADESIGSDLLVQNGNSGEAVISTGSESLPAGQSNVQISSESGSLAKESQKSEVDDRKGRSSQVVISHDIESLAAENRGSGILVETTVVDSVEGRGCPVDEMGNHKHSTVQSMTAPGEDVTGESKERFRERLWCFLFENLNRAVDELYLLCELECDVEQMKEAILVLEEAASDFKELTNRVKDFEHVKKSTSISLDGSPVTLKSDHRRPHALSWEVRRMTTSPHKAEILSSSLEAFKKIQQERVIKIAADKSKILESECSNHSGASVDILKKSAGKIERTTHNRDSISKSRNQIESSDTKCDSNGEKRNVELGRSNKVHFVQNGHSHQNNSSSGFNFSRPSSWDSPTTSVFGKSEGENEEKLLHKKDKSLTGSTSESTHFKSTDHLKKQVSLSEKDKEKKISASWKSMNAWKEKRNWEEILSSPFRVSSRVSRSPGLSRKSAERARILHDKLMSPEKKKKTGLDLKKEAEEKHARAMRIRTELETERVQKLQRTSEKLNRVSEWQAVRTMKLREGMYARHQRSESRHEAFIAQVVKRAGDESSKVSEVRFITSLNEENKKLMLRQKLQDSELRRAEKLQIMKTKQKEDMAREEAVLERRKLIEAEKLQRLAETQRKKEEAQVRREEERKASSAAREARAIEQLRRREERAKAQQEEAELLAQKLAERLRESEQRRKFYLEQIKERASMDFRDQSSPLLRRSGNKEGQGRSTPTKSGEDFQENGVADTVASSLSTGQVTLQHSLKRRIKKIRQRLMAMKYEFLEPTVGSEAASIGYRTTVGTARAKIGRWLQELQRLRQARKEGAASIGLITADIVKFVDGKDAELQAARQAGLLDFIASALPASHTSRPEDCRVTLHFLKLLRVVLSAFANRSYFLAQNLLPPIVPMLSSALENYIKIAASLNAPGGSNFPPSKTSLENFETISEVLENFLCTVCAVVGHTSSDERELQMQDGLLELLTAYQVIHRLRDLFALYDRPQVEGSPFPPSILLSIHLLVVLTSRPTTCGTIDWEHSLPERVLGFETQETKPAETAESTEDCRPPLPMLNDGTAVPPSDISDNMMLDELHNMTRSVGLLSIGNGFEKSNQGTIELGKSKSISADASDESPTIIIEKDERKLVHFSAKQNDGNGVGVKQPLAFLLSAISDTGLVCLPSLLTAVLLQANNRLSSELGTYVLPSNFEEVATGVLKVLNNLALMDITFIQRMLARPDLKMEFFHLVSFLLSHCTSKWKAASDQVGLLLLESLSLLGYFSLFHPENQAVLRWGKSPTILHKVCDLPFIFFSDSGLMPILASTLVAACYGCEQNKGVIQQELSMDMLLSLLRSCKNALPANPSIDILPNYGPSENIQQNSELRKSLVDTSLRPSRYNGKSSRVSVGKGGALGRGGKIRSQRVYKATKACEEMLQKHKPLVPQTSVMLHCRFPSNFIDKAEQFFSAGITKVGNDV